MGRLAGGGAWRCLRAKRGEGCAAWRVGAAGAGHRCPSLPRVRPTAAMHTLARASCGARALRAPAGAQRLRSLANIDAAPRWVCRARRCLATAGRGPAGGGVHRRMQLKRTDGWERGAARRGSRGCVDPRRARRGTGSSRGRARCSEGPRAARCACGGTARTAARARA
ncbi:MAG: hypothetical protein J3K34DRAFT_405944 [Monoraphidium minutum]|nr:MAG: hypothetical protein J3K34DRAFT_405944 [Monoraphidium minutum]